jgi:hypothetical protein
LLLLRSRLHCCWASTMPLRRHFHQDGIVSVSQSQLKRWTSSSARARQVASAFTLLPMQLVSQWKRRTFFQWHINWQQQAHQQVPRGCVGSKSPSQVLTELGNVGLSWQEGGWNRMWFQCIVCHSGYKQVQWLYLSILCNPCY